MASHWRRRLEVVVGKSQRPAEPPPRRNTLISGLARPVLVDFAKTSQDVLGRLDANNLEIGMFDRSAPRLRDLCQGGDKAPESQRRRLTVATDRSRRSAVPTRTHRDADVGASCDYRADVSVVPALLSAEIDARMLRALEIGTWRTSTGDIDILTGSSGPRPDQTGCLPAPCGGGDQAPGRRPAHPRRLARQHHRFRADLRWSEGSSGARGAPRAPWSLIGGPPAGVCGHSAADIFGRLASAPQVRIVWHSGFCPQSYWYRGWQGWPVPDLEANVWRGEADVKGGPSGPAEGSPARGDLDGSETDASMCPSPEATIRSGHRLAGTAAMRRGARGEHVAGAGHRHKGHAPPRFSRWLSGKGGVVRPV
jgi:hypothetical protein